MENYIFYRKRYTALATAAALAMLLASGSCGGAMRPQASAPSGRYKITVVEAALASHRPDGSPWHVQEPDGSATLMGGLVGLALGNPLAGLAMGSALEAGANEYPPSPYVEIKIGNQTFATLPAGPTLSPRWRYPIAIDITSIDKTEPVIILIRDAYDRGVISQARTTLAGLIDTPLTRFFELGSVVTLDISAEPLPPTPENKNYQIYVPGARSAAQLIAAERAAPAEGDWQRVPLLNGDVVVISAVGEVCPSSWNASECFDANGAAQRWQAYNYPEFKDAPHAALVGIYADVPVLVGSSTVFRAQRSGWLMLFVNDTDTSNNSGGFQAWVQVNPPDYNP